MWNAITLVQDLNSCRRVHSGTYIVYNSQVTCSNSSFPLTMVYAYVFTSLLSIGYIACSPLATCPSPLLLGGCIYHHSPNSTTSTDHGDIPIITLLILSSAGCSCLNIRDTQNLWAWWHCGDPILSMYLSTPSAVFTPAGHVYILHEQIPFGKVWIPLSFQLWVK